MNHTYLLYFIDLNHQHNVLTHKFSNFCSNSKQQSVILCIRVYTNIQYDASNHCRSFYSQPSRLAAISKYKYYSTLSAPPHFPSLDPPAPGSGICATYRSKDVSTTASVMLHVRARPNNFYLLSTISQTTVILETKNKYTHKQVSNERDDSAWQRNCWIKCGTWWKARS